jgi:LysM repeat protein
MIMKRALPIVIVIACLTVVWGGVQAQAPGTCPALVEQALAALSDNCGDLDRNAACYGFNQVDSTFTVPVESGFFSAPADRTELTTLETIRTSPLDLAEERWGIAVMNVQANLPGTLPGQAVTFILMGDAEVANQVAADEAFTGGDPVTVTTLSAVDARSGPSINSNVVGTVPATTDLQADAVSRLGDWLRVVVEDRPAWIPRAEIAANDAVDGLPVFTGSSQSPMQAFYFTTGIGQAGCMEAPSALSIRGPQNIEVDLNVNGLDVRIGSTITLQQLGPNQIGFTVMEGELQTVTGDIVLAGQTLPALTDADGRILNLDDVRDATEFEMQVGQVVTQVQDVVNPLAEDDESGPLTNDAGEIIHIVQAGETLFAIARLYDASMPAIVARNSLSDPTTIFVGQQLVIPNPGSGFVGINLPPTNNTDNPPPPPQTTGQCAGFQLTSPLTGLAYGANTFYWDPAPGADSYRVIVSNLETRQTLANDVPAPRTSTQFDLTNETIGAGFSFAWEVQAFLDDTLICSGQRITLQRASPAGGNPGTTMIATWSCTGVMQTQIVYSGVPAGNMIEFTYTYFDGFSTQSGFSGGHPAPSGSTGALGSKFDTNYSGTATAIPSGVTVPITPGTSPSC